MEGPEFLITKTLIMLVGPLCEHPTQAIHHHGEKKGGERVSPSKISIGPD